MNKLVEELLQGNRRALARILTLVENQRPGMQEALRLLFPHTGSAWIIGVTGAPGTGKSSLVNAMAKAYRARQQTLGIIAVDPTSPFSGGAILGDRIRMNDLSGDRGIFIRSMATRGSLGGLAGGTRDAVRVMDAAGFDYIIVETVGAGQSEVEVVRTAHTTLVVEAPGLGDDVQAIKAGILEIADILVVNKADRNGANQTVRGLKAMLELGHPTAHMQYDAHHGRLVAAKEPEPTADSHATLWVPPVIKTVAIAADGVDDLLDGIASHRKYLTESGGAAQLQARYIEIELYERLQQALMQRLVQAVAAEMVAELIEKILAREIDPHSAVESLLEQFE